MLLGALGPAAAQDRGASCQTCHAAIAAAYRQTGMGRSVSRLTPQTAGEEFRAAASFHHGASGRYYTILERGGRYFQRRHQLDSAGREVNVIEKEIHYVMGSGNHARTYLHRSPRGALLQLPVGWYSEGGGKWAMSPGYDHPRHEDFRREIAAPCLACHNAYPVAGGPELPEGIDCSRCHGPGEEHGRLAAAGAGIGQIRRAIVNPARLDRERALDICLQCHLQSMAGELPYAVRLPGRDPFSFRAGERLAGHAIHFEPSDGAARKRFEIDSAGYRMLQSACYRESGRKLLCTTCHDPHRARRGAEAVRQTTQACLGCHSPPAGAGHPKAAECVSCHMPKRRAEDVVHVVMTDHAIVRRPPPGDPRAPLQEKLGPRYRGEVRAYYPAELPETPGTRLVVALAQVIEDSNTGTGAALLESVIQAMADPPVQALLELGRAYGRLGRLEEAQRWLRLAIERDPAGSAAPAALGGLLVTAGDPGAAAGLFRRAHELDAENSRTLADLGAALVLTGAFEEASRVLAKAVAVNPDLPEARNSLGLAFQGLGRMAEALAAFGEAIRLQPDYAEAHVNRGIVLASVERLPEAQAAFRAALRHDPRSAGAHYNYGLALARSGDGDAAAGHFRETIEIDPGAQEARLHLAVHYLERRRYAEAQQLMEQLLERQPRLARASLYLGFALLEQGRRREAEAHLNNAAAGGDAEVRRSAENLLQRIR